MGKKGVVVTAGVFAVITVMSGVAAAVFMGLSVYHLGDYDEYFCSFRPSLARIIGTGAAALTLTTQILASTAIGCCGAWRNVPSQTRRVVAVLLFIGSWVLAIKEMILFMAGAWLGFVGYMRDIFENGCIARGVGIFVAATILLLIVVALDIACYIMVQKAGLEFKRPVGLEKPTGTTTMGAPYVAKC